MPKPTTPRNRPRLKLGAQALTLAGHALVSSVTHAARAGLRLGSRVRPQRQVRHERSEDAMESPCL